MLTDVDWSSGVPDEEHDSHAQQWATELVYGTRVRFQVVLSVKLPPPGVSTIRFFGTKTELDELIARLPQTQPV